MSESLIGRTLGKYQILEKLGQGGMGMVFKALQPSLNRTVAIKVLPAQLAMDPEFVQRFRQEAQVIASLQHESIVHVYDIDEAVLASGEKLYFIVMELVEGQTLRQWAGRGRALPTHEVQRIGRELARALEYAHQRGIVHRDIKSANAMVTRDSKVKLMDFGIAKSAGGFRTVTGSVLGTPEYMAPEQARSGKVTAQSDIYSLGVLLYEIATGRLPFSGEDAFAIALQHLSKDPPRPREVNAGVPEWLEKVILRAMAKEPGDRFATAGQLEAELASGGGEEPPLAATLGDPQAPTLLAGATPPGWPLTPQPGAAAAASPAPSPASWPSPPPSSPTGAHLPTTPIDAGRFGATPPGARLPPTPPGSYPPPTGSPTPLAGPGWGAAGAYVPPTPSPAAPGWDSPPPVPPPSWPPTPPPPAPATHYPTPTHPSSATGSRRGGLKGWMIGALVLLAGIGVVLGALWSRPDKVEIDRGEVVQPGFDPATPPPLPESTGEMAEGEKPAAPAPRPSGIPGTPAAPKPPPLERTYQESEERAPEPPAKEPAEPSEPAGPTAGELWSQAYRLKEDEQYHSLRQVLDRLLAKDADYGEARNWRRKVDGWAVDREKDLRGEADDLVDELVDALEDRDTSNLAELWGGSYDAATEAFAQGLWDLAPKLKWTARIRTFKPWDDRATFVLLITVADKNGKKLREIAWNGAMADDKEGVRFTVPLR